MSMFIDRKDELKLLREIANSKKAELVLVYGRRRVGKSSLLTEFAKEVNARYFMADISENVLDILAKQVPEQFVRFATWEDFFEYIQKCEEKVIIIDEFQYLYQVNKAWPTILQRWWEKIKQTDKKIILCGSIISTIYKIAMGYGSALYGRKTREMQIVPLPFRYVKEFFPQYSFKQLIEVYAIVGGIPRYLEEFNPTESIDENIQRKIIDKTSFLYNEPVNLLFEEFRTPAPYNSILLAITQGYIKFAEIADMSKIESFRLPKYLFVLERVGLIEKEIPVTEKKIRGKTTRYKIKDNFYRFWFHFIFQKKAFIEQGLQTEVFSALKTEFNAYVGSLFEEVCKEYILDTRMFAFTTLGRWWQKDMEIDIVAINDETKEILCAECKWQDHVDAKKLLENLKRKAVAIPHTKTYSTRYILFAKSFKEQFKEERVTLLNLHEMEESWKRL